MEMDIAALQRLPEVTGAEGLDLLPLPPCRLPTVVLCAAPSCVRTTVVITTPPGQ